MTRTRGRAAIDEIVRWRRANQPGGANAGSVFTNPPGDSAGRLIDACGLKGFRIGHRRGVAQARQLHPGRSGRLGRRRPPVMDHVRADVAGRHRGRPPHRGTHDRLPRPEEGADRRAPDDPEARPRPDERRPSTPGSASGGWTIRRSAADAAGCRLADRRAVAVIALVVVAGVGSLHTPWFSAKVVSGHRPPSAHRRPPPSWRPPGSIGHPPLISVDPGPAAARVESLPFIATAQVTATGPTG